MELITTKRESGTRRVQHKLNPESMAEQGHSKECNINHIVARYKKTGLFPQRSGEPKYGDFTNAGDFQDAQNRIIQAKEEFSQLPSDIREIFENSPAKLLDFLADPQNAAEAIKMGLLPPNPISAVDQSELAPEPAPEPVNEPVNEPINEPTA